MSLLNKLKSLGSVFTKYDGTTPTTYDQKGKLNPNSLSGSILDLDGKTPKVPGKLPYLDNLPE